MILRGTIRVGDNTTTHNCHLGMHARPETLAEIRAAYLAADEEQLHAVLERCLRDEYIGYPDVELVSVESLIVPD